MNNSYPTVATIIGCPEELKQADGLLATPIVLEEDVGEPTVQQFLPDTSNIKDPVQKAVVDNILGKVSTKMPQEKFKCDICRLELSARCALLSHLSGARHAKRLKEEIFDKDPLPSFIQLIEENNMYRCTLCNITMNAKIQIIAHMQGAKHKNKTGVSSCTIAEDSLKGNSYGLKSGIMTKDSSLTPKAASLKCSVCNIVVNSETQYQQHASSMKHLNKLGNRGGGANGKPRHTPYSSSGRGWSEPARAFIQRKTSQQAIYRQYPRGESYSTQVTTYSLSNNFVSSGYSSQQQYSHSPQYKQQAYPPTYG